MINHRYHIVNKLGEGGSGQVFLVEDTLGQRQQFAMKIFHRNDQSEDVAGQQFRNEVSILAMMYHPNLVRVFDFGIVRQAEDDSLNGCRFLTMEYINGVPAREWYRSLHSDQDRVLQLTYLIQQALEVLAYVHRQGIIHFDIKPDNLLLISAGEKENDMPLLKLTDFGFSMKKDASHDLPLRGTLEYTAPELLRRDPFDHRIDLYSLGATLYHLIENRCPFEATDPVELIKRVLTTEPEFHRSATSDFVPLLSFLKKLLHKDPSHRFQSATEAVLTLEAGPSPTIAFDRIAKPSFVGREEEKKRIGKAISSLGTRHTGEAEVALVIQGSEGIGKTALLAEMVRFARASDVLVVEVSGSQLDIPFGAVLSLFSCLKAEVLSRTTDGVRLIERFVDAIDTGDQARAENEKGPHTEWMREREKTIESQARFITEASLLFPLMIAVDDMDLLDSESREVLKTAVREGSPGRLLVLLAERHESSSSVAATRVPLGELDSDGVAAMSASVLSPFSIGQTIGMRLFQLYGGTPSIIVEALYSADKLLRSEGPGATSDIATFAERVIDQLPRDLDQFLLTRYKSLDRGSQLTLDILSCFIGSARIEVIGALLPFPRQRTAANLASLEAQTLVTSHDSSHRIAMRHAKLKTMIGASINSRQDIHLFIAGTLEQFPGVRSFADLRELAYQYKAGGQNATAVTWLEAAADEGVRLAAFHLAKELYQEAIALVGREDTPNLDRLNVKLTQALFNSGLFREAVELTNRLLGKSHLENGQRIEIHKTAGLALSRLGEYAEAMRHIEEAWKSSTDGQERVELVQEMVGIEIALGNFLEAERAAIAQLDRAKRFGSQRMIASIYTDLGIATFCQDLFDRSVEYFQESMKIYAALKQNARMADAMMNIGNVMSAKGDIAPAIEQWKEALNISREYGTLNQQALIENNLGIAHYKLKQFEEARHFYDKAGAIFRRLHSKQGSSYVLTNYGEVCFAEGQYERALQHWEQARKLYCEMEDGRGIVETMLQLAQVNLVLGDIESVAGNLDHAEALTNEKNLETFRSQLLYLRGIRMMLLGDYEAAREFLKKAQECAHESWEIADRLLLEVRMAECDHRIGEHDSAVALAQKAMERGEKGSHPKIIAEACLLLGMIAKASPSNVPEKPLVCFRKGLEAIAKEPVTEVTWKLALALGQEFYERGQKERAKEFLLRAKLVLQFFLGQFNSSKLKNQYLAIENKDKVVAALESFLKT